MRIVVSWSAKRHGAQTGDRRSRLLALTMALLLLLCIFPTPRVARAAQTTIQPGPTDGTDTFVWADNPSLNRGSITYMYVRVLSYAETWACAVALIKFDLSSLAGVTITSATLYLYESTAGWWDRGTVYAHRILPADSAWTETGATWNYAKASTNRWAGDVGNNGGTDAGCTQSGVDWDATPLGSVDCGNLDLPQGYEFAMTWDLVEFQEMISNNYGFVLYSTSTLGLTPYSSDETTYTSWRPKLVVVYAEVDTYASDYSTLKDPYTIGETVYAKATGLPSVAAWLSGWDNRVKMTIDKNDITSSLSNFPVLIHLSTSSGRGPDDVSFVFDEIQGNSKKIAVTRGDGITECYVEIERWDYASEQAWLWTKASSVSSSADTDLYLYYDKDHADNTARVGDIGSTPAKSVWDTNSRGVWHLNESSGTAKDSTTYGTSGTYSGSPYAQGVSGKIDGASDFGPSSSGRISCGDPSDGHLDFGSNSFTVEFWVNYDGPVSGYFEIPLYKGGSYSGDIGYDVEISQYSPYNIYFQAADGTNLACSPVTATPQDTWTYFVGVCDRSATKIRLFKDGTEVGTGNGLGSLGSVSTSVSLYFPRGTSSYLEDLTLDEVRISTGRRSDAWIKASYESGRDHLIDFGSIYDIKYYSNWDGSPVQRGSQLNVGESPSGEWRSLYTIKGSDPAGSWGVRVYDAGTSTLITSCSFTVVPGAQEFPYGSMVALVIVYTIYLAKKKNLKRGLAHITTVLLDGHSMTRASC